MTLLKIAPVWTPESQQAIFRAMLTSLSFPGRIQDISLPLADMRAEVGVLAAVIDEQVSLADPHHLLSPAERRLLAPGAFVAPEEAEYLLFPGAVPPRDGFRPTIGTLYRPDDAALLVLRVEELAPPSLTNAGGYLVTLRGPGVETEQHFTVSGIHPDWFTARDRWCINLPTGCDFILCDNTHIVGLPRTVTLALAPEAR